MTALTLTLIGRDRPGLVRALSEKIAAVGGNWLESRMARLAGQFAGILQVDVPAAEVERLIADLQALEQEGLRATIVQGLGEEAPAQSPDLAAGAGRAGSARHRARDRAGPGRPAGEHRGADHARGQRLVLGREPVRGRGPLARSRPMCRPEEVRHLLETLANELMVDITLE